MTSRARVLRRSPVSPTESAADLGKILLGDLEEMYHRQDVELQAALFHQTPEEAEKTLAAENRRAAPEASKEEREKERLRRRRRKLAIEWFLQKGLD